MNKYIMPIHFIVRKKKIFLGMNWYKAAHWSIQNPSKKLYHKMVIDQLDNILHNKYFLDALVENENLPDDCLKYYLGMHTDYIIDKTLETPYVCIEILEIS